MRQSGFGRNGHGPGELDVLRSQYSFFYEYGFCAVGLEPTMRLMNIVLEEEYIYKTIIFARNIYFSISHKSVRVLYEVRIYDLC